MSLADAVPTAVLSHHLRREREAHPALDEELAALLGEIALAGKIIAREVARAPLTGRLGDTGETNVQGEPVKQLDRWANAALVDILHTSRLVSLLVSEELPEPMVAGACHGQHRYVVCFDPLDGSLNADINGVVGTIFGIRPGRPAVDPDPAAAAFGPGTAQVAAGYIMYGPATVMVYTAGYGVHALTLDATTGEFVLTHTLLRMPRRGTTYGVNEGNWHRWVPEARAFVEAIKRGHDDAAPHSLRYVGSLVGDFHRILLQGGVYLYPAELRHGRPAGKLRLLYEAAPLALVAEQAGGRASTGTGPILDVVATQPHQRVPLYIGSTDEIARAEAFHRTPRADG